MNQLLELAALAAFGATLLLVVRADLREFRIPDRVLGYGTMGVVALLALTAAAAGDIALLRRAVAGALVSFGIYLVLHLVARGAIGFGDVKLAALIGLVTGWFGAGAALVAVAAGFVAAGLTAIVLLITRQGTKHTAIPLAPFMALGAVFAVGFAFQ